MITEEDDLYLVTSYCHGLFSRHELISVSAHQISLYYDVPSIMSKTSAATQKT